MQHFSCDYCGRTIPNSSRRFEVKMEVYASNEATMLQESDLESFDPLEELEDTLAEQLPITTFQKMRYDLCPSCHERFLADPLGRDLTRKFDFSEN
jgi:hypothetical protein